MKIWREVHGGSIRRATILTTSMPVMETTLLVVIDNIGYESQHKRMDVNSISICTLREGTMGQQIPSPRWPQKEHLKWTQTSEAVESPIMTTIVVITTTRNSGYQRNVG